MTPEKRAMKILDLGGSILLPFREDESPDIGISFSRVILFKLIVEALSEEQEMRKKILLETGLSGAKGNHL